VLREAENAYALNENTEVHFLMSGGQPEWTTLYIGALLLDAKYRVN
jgi:hypothetical protein